MVPTRKVHTHSLCCFIMQPLRAKLTQRFKKSIRFPVINMNHENKPSGEPANPTDNVLSNQSELQNSSPPAKRSEPFIWVSWLTKLMAGEKQCEWASWFRSQYVWDKLPSGLDVAKWTAEHAQLLRARRAALEAEGFTVYAEDQNAFTLTGKTGIKVSGKPDIVAIRDQEAYVEDCKTGSPRHSDHFQVLIYMLALPHVEGPWKGLKLNGRIIYGIPLWTFPHLRLMPV